MLEKIALEKEVGELCGIETQGKGGDMGATAARRSLNAVFQEKWDVVVAESLMSRSILVRLNEYTKNESKNEVAKLVMRSATEMYFVGLIAETLQLFTEGDSRRKLDLAGHRNPAGIDSRNLLSLRRGRTVLGDMTVFLDLDQPTYQEEKRLREEMLKKGKHHYLVAARSELDAGELSEGGWACSLAGTRISDGSGTLTLGSVEVNVPIEPTFDRIRLLLSLTR
jgi:hypothetical protein